MILPEQCFKEDALAAVIHALGLEEIEIFKLLSGEFFLKVRVKSNAEPLYLSTQREPFKPRRFKKIDAAVTVALKLVGDDCRFVVRSEKAYQR